MNFTSFSCSAGSLSVTVLYWPKLTQSEKPSNASTAGLNLRHARVVARWAHNSAVIAGVLAAFFGSWP
ncbi:hypothetical protein [Streptomyces sp. 2-1]|uniref:hypothetical protein n=1 Tax=Streptomyces sp. 2-1 TaxID=412710 RepID=UPI003AFA5DAF